MSNDSRDLALSHMLDLAHACSRIGDARFSRFLEPIHENAAKSAAKQCGVSLSLFGGCEMAERKMACFYPLYETEPSNAEWPMCCLCLMWNAKYGNVAHRDLLGAVMGQGLDRACLGDIVMGNGRAFLFATPEAARYLLVNLGEAGRVKLKIEEVPFSDVTPKEPEGRRFRVTVASLRLDAVLAEGFNLPRQQAQSLIGRGLVKLNHQVVDKNENRLCEGDLISCRGYGRIRLEGDMGETKKGRRALTLFLFGN